MKVKSKQGMKKCTWTVPEYRIFLICQLSCAGFYFLNGQLCSWLVFWRGPSGLGRARASVAMVASPQVLGFYGTVYTEVVSASCLLIITAGLVIQMH